MTRFFVFGALMLVGCTDGYSDVVGPFSGDTHALAIASFDWPQLPEDADAVADDLDGDGRVDNFLGHSIQAIGQFGDVKTDTRGIGSVIALQAMDFTDDARAGATYLGAADDPATVAGGTIAGGAFVSNPTRETHVPGGATLRLPIFTGAEPSVVTARGVEIEIAADGLSAIVRGGIAAADVHRAIGVGISQMLAAEPGEHPNIVSACDLDGDMHVTDAELDACPIVQTFSKPDIALFEGGEYHPHAVQTDDPDSMSFAFRVHLSQQ